MDSPLVKDLTEAALGTACLETGVPAEEIQVITVLVVKGELTYSSNLPNPQAFMNVLGIVGMLAQRLVLQAQLEQLDSQLGSAADKPMDAPVEPTPATPAKRKSRR